jgi:hypothetical protein
LHGQGLFELHDLLFRERNRLIIPESRLALVQLNGLLRCEYALSHNALGDAIHSHTDSDELPITVKAHTFAVLLCASPISAI